MIWWQTRSDGTAVTIRSTTIVPDRAEVESRLAEAEAWLRRTLGSGALLVHRHEVGSSDPYERLRKITGSRRRGSKTDLINVHELVDLVGQQELRCALTGRKLRPKQAALDHITPISRGGSHVIDNAQILDKRVNRAKGTMNNDEFIKLCCAVARHARRRRKAKRTGAA